MIVLTVFFRLDYPVSDSLKNARFLESPLLVQGLSAAVISHCQIHQIPAALFLSLEDEIKISESTLSIWEAPLSAAIASSNANKKKEYTKVLSKLSAKIPSNLYI